MEESKRSEAKRLYLEGETTVSIAAAFRTSRRNIKREIGQLTAAERQQHREQAHRKNLSIYRWAENRRRKYGESARVARRKVYHLYRAALRKGYASQEETITIESRRRTYSP